LQRAPDYKRSNAEATPPTLRSRLRLCSLGKLRSGEEPGRMSPHEITIYKSMGHAIEDLTASELILERTLRRSRRDAAC